MNQEEILIQGEAIQTVIRYFTTFSGQTSDDDKIYYVITDIGNQPIKLVESEIETKFALDNLNINLSLSALTGGYNVYSGSVVENKVNQKINSNERAYISEDYEGKIKYQAKESSPTKQIPSDLFTFVFFEEKPFNDYFMNVKINRSTSVLDTLNIYNVPVNQSPSFTNDTGVLFGKIEALQPILDSNGEKLRIPLKNAVVGIFNPSEEIPSVGSVDEDGNRIQLNLFENLPTVNGVANIRSYGSFQSYLVDYEFSPKDIVNDSIPPKYKYTCITNDYGEFILHNIPVGQQTLMIEVDLLKQGLDPEEVALNFFPYPTTDAPNIADIPHLYFNQFPVNIVPSWGDFQTGYTQIDLSIALDLRKWITYFSYPISSKVGNPNEIGNQNLGQSPKVLEELVAMGVNNTFTIEIRDMTKPFVVDAPPKLEIVKIIDIYDRNLDLNCAWLQEFKVRANKVQYNTTNYNAFKIPANLYDFNGIDSKGNKGVWIGAYQLKSSFPDPTISCQTTGFAEEWKKDADGTVKYYKSNHYDLNRFDGWADDVEKDSPPPGSGVGIFPYEQPWSLTYPEPYKITKPPKIYNPLKSWDSNTGQFNFTKDIVNNNGQTNTIILNAGEEYLQPRFLDGDLAGGPDCWGTNANGFGLQIYSDVWGGNNFSREVTKNEVWRYEAVDHWREDWSNGYNEQLTPSDFNKYPNTPNGKPQIIGERWQRLEAGYAYWLRPRGWPRIKNESWGDHLLDNDYNPFANHNYNSIWQSPYDFNSYYPVVYRYIDEVTLVVGNRTEFYAKFGRLNIYRVEKPYYLNPKKPPFTEKYARFKFQDLIVDQSKRNADSDSKSNKGGKKTTCYPSRSRFGGSRCTNSGYGDRADAHIWLELGGYNPSPGNNFLQECNVQFCTIQAAGSVVEYVLVNIGTTKVNVNGKELLPGVRDNNIKFRLLHQQEILLPANDKYSPKDNCYNGASYLFFIGNCTNPRGMATNLGPRVQPIYKYQVGVEGEEVTYYLTSMIPRQVGIGNSKCNAVRDYNTAAGFSFSIGGIFNLAIAALLINAFPITAFLVVVVLPKEIRQEISSTLRSFCSQDAYKFNADWRQDKRLGIYINGLGWYLPNAFSYINDYFLNRLGGNLLPYIGDETAEAQKVNFRNWVPYFNASWYSEFRSHIASSSPLAVFQPRPLIPNNLKGTGNFPYYMEFLAPYDNTTIFIDYSKGF